MSHELAALPSALDLETEADRAAPDRAGIKKEPWPEAAFAFRTRVVALVLALPAAGAFWTASDLQSRFRRPVEPSHGHRPRCLLSLPLQKLL